METAEQAEPSLNHARSSDASESNSSNYVAVVKKLLYRPMLVGIKDGRFFIGSFYCMDKQWNIILQDAVEYRSTRRSSSSPMEQRGVGLILIPFLVELLVMWIAPLKNICLYCHYVRKNRNFMCMM